MTAQFWYETSPCFTDMGAGDKRRPFNPHGVWLITDDDSTEEVLERENVANLVKHANSRESPRVNSHTWCVLRSPPFSVTQSVGVV